MLSVQEVLGFVVVRLAQVALVAQQVVAQQQVAFALVASPRADSAI